MALLAVYTNPRRGLYSLLANAPMSPSEEKILRLVAMSERARLAVSSALRKRPMKVHISGDRGQYVRFRMADPKKYGSFATIRLGKHGTLGVIGRTGPGKSELQSVLVPKARVFAVARKYLAPAMPRKVATNPPDQHGLKKLSIYKVLHSPELKQKGLAGKAVVFLGMVEGPAGGMWAAIRPMDSENEHMIRPWLLVDPSRSRYPNPLTRAEHDEVMRREEMLYGRGDHARAAEARYLAAKYRGGAELVRPNSGKRGYYVMGPSGGVGTMSRAWYPTRAQAEAEVKRIVMIGAWRDRPPWVEESQGPGGYRRAKNNPFYITDQAGFNRDKPFATKSAAKKALWFHRPVVRHSTRDGVPVGKYTGEFVWAKNSRRNPEHEELKRTLYAHLRKTFGHEPGDEFDIEAAIYWYAAHHYAGMGDPLYAIISTSPYKPGRMKSDASDEGETAGMMYDALVRKFGAKRNPRRNPIVPRGFHNPRRRYVVTMRGQYATGGSMETFAADVFASSDREAAKKAVEAARRVGWRNVSVARLAAKNPLTKREQKQIYSDADRRWKDAARYQIGGIVRAGMEGRALGMLDVSHDYGVKRNAKNPLTQRETKSLLKQARDSASVARESTGLDPAWRAFFAGRASGRAGAAEYFGSKKLRDRAWRIEKYAHKIALGRSRKLDPALPNPLTNRESASLLRGALRETREAKRRAKQEWWTHSGFHAGVGAGLAASVQRFGTTKRARWIASSVRARARSVPVLHLHKNNEGNATPNIPFVQGRKYKPEVIERWVATQSSPVQQRWAQAVKQYKSFHLGAMPESVTFNVQMLGVSKGITDVEFGVSEGKEWMAPYQVPKHSGKFEGDASQGRYVHAHGDSQIDVNIKRPAKLSRLPERFHTPDGKFVGVIPAGTKVKISDWYRH